MSKCPLDKMMDCHKHHTQTDAEPCGERDWLAVSLCPNLALFSVIVCIVGKEQCRICRVWHLWLNGLSWLYIYDYKVGTMREISDKFKK